MEKDREEIIVFMYYFFCKKSLKIEKRNIKNWLMEKSYGNK